MMVDVRDDKKCYGFPSSNFDQSIISKSIYLSYLKHTFDTF